MKQRVIWVDWAKVICIYLMVCCHAGQNGILLNLTYQFHMPAFLIISGMLFRFRGIVKELKSFGIPIMLFGLITLFYRIVQLMFKIGCFNSDFIEQLKIIIKESFKSLIFDSQISWFQGYWFVVTLLFVRFLLGWNVIAKHKVKVGIICILWCCIENLIVIPDSIMLFKPYHMISCLPFFITGMILKEKKFNPTKGAIELKFILMIIFFILTFYQGQIDLVYYSYGMNYLIMFINALCGSWLLFSLCSKLPFRSYIQVLSTGTFMILGIHGIMYGNITKLFYKYLNVNIPLITSLLVLLLLYPIIFWLIKKAPLILGKTH